MPVQRLDYANAPLMIEVTNQIEATFRLHACAKEPWTVGFIERAARENLHAAFVDVGANVGPYTLIAIANGLHVLAIEPGYENHARLCHNLALNNVLARALTPLCLLGPGDGWQYMHYHDLRAGAASHVIGGERRQGFHQQVVQMRSLDSLMASVKPVPGFDGPYYLKVDVDGGEQAVLTGAQNVLRDECLRGLLIEAPLANEAAITDYIVRHGLAVSGRYDERSGQKIPGICYLEFNRG